MTKPANPPRNRVRERAWTLFFMFAVTLVFGATVSGLHVATQARVRENGTLFLRRAVRAAAGLPKLPDAELPAWFASAVAPVTNAARPHYEVRLSGEASAPRVRVFERAGAGLWGTIRAAVGVAEDAGGPTLSGVAILEQQETPGLGARIDEPWFAEQLRGKRGTLKLVAEGTRSPAVDEIDGITGATITSAAVRDILNRVLSEDAAAATPPQERSAPDGQDERR